MAPFGVLSIIRHLVLRGLKRGLYILTTAHIRFGIHGNITAEFCDQVIAETGRVRKQLLMAAVRTVMHAQQTLRDERSDQLLAALLSLLLISATPEDVCQTEGIHAISNQIKPTISAAQVSNRGKTCA